MTETPAATLVAPSDIAEMVDMSRAAVSNWRKRHDDFPPQVAGTPAKPLFDRGAVVAWLEKQGHKIQTDLGESQVWAALNRFRGNLDVDASAALLLSLACAKKLSAQTEEPVWGELLATVSTQGLRPLADQAAARVTEDGRWELAWLPDSIVEVPIPLAATAVEGLNHVKLSALAEVTDAVLAKTARAKMKQGLEYGFVGSRTSQALTNLAMAVGNDAKVLYDPACGTGVALTDILKAGLEPERVVGHELVDPIRIQAAQRAFLHDLDVELTTADVLAADPDPELRADIVVAEPPFGLQLPPSFDPTDRRWVFGLPPKSSSDAAWLQHVVAHLTETGTGFVLTPAGTLTRAGADRAVRTELLRRGCVEAVVALPARMLPHVGAPLAIWVLRAPRDTAHSEVVLIDGTDVEDVEQHVGTWLTASRENAELNAPFARVDVRDVLAADSDLTPLRWVQPDDLDPEAVAAEYQRSWGDLTRRLEHIAGAGSSLRQAAGTSQARIVTLGDWVNQGMLQVRPGRASRRDIPEHLAHRFVGPSEVRRGKLDDVLDEEPVPKALQSNLTVEGDVLLLVQGTVAAVVDEGGGHLVGPGVHRIRVANAAHLGSHYLALVLAGSWNQRFLAGSSLPRADWRLLEVPLVPSKDQANVYLADVAAKLLQEEAEKLAEATATLRRTMLEALRHGIDLPEDPA